MKRSQSAAEREWHRARKRKLYDERNGSVEDRAQVILTTLRGSPSTRAQLTERLNYSPGAIDAALGYLNARRLIRRRGKRWAAKAPSDRSLD